MQQTFDQLAVTRGAHAPTASYVLLSVIVPAYNEHYSLPGTLCALRESAQQLEAYRMGRAELIVVDDSSQDDTATIANQFADKVVKGTRCGIGQARNRGAAIARGSILVFVDADTLVDDGVLVAIKESWDSGVRAGGVAAVYESSRWPIRTLLLLWRWYAAKKEMTQGVCQFFDRDLFHELGGYSPMPEPGSPHGMINLESEPEHSICKLSPMNRLL